MSEPKITARIASGLLSGSLIEDIAFSASKPHYRWASQGEADTHVAKDETKDASYITATLIYDSENQADVISALETLMDSNDKPVTVIEILGNDGVTVADSITGGMSLESFETSIPKNDICRTSVQIARDVYITS